MSDEKVFFTIRKDPSGAATHYTFTETDINRRIGPVFIEELVKAVMAAMVNKFVDERGAELLNELSNDVIRKGVEAELARRVLGASK